MTIKRVLWLTQHKPNKEQIEALKKAFGEQTQIMLYKDCFDKEITEKLENSPTEEYKLFDLAFKVRDRIEELGVDVIHLPIGSPAFMFVLTLLLYKSKRRIIFSHTDRIVEEIDNKKVSIFKFKKFIKF